MRYRCERSKRTAAISIISFFAISLLACAARAQNTQVYAPFPSPAADQITDLANVLASDSRAAINASLDNHKRSTGVEIRVLTINAMADYPGTPNSSIEAFATGLFNRWQIGKLPRNDGVLLLVSVKDRKARIEVGKGYNRARDAAAQRIMSNVIVPRLRVNDFPAGVREGVDALVREFNGRQSAQSAAPPTRSPIANNYSQNPNARPAVPVAQLSPRKKFFTDEMIGLLFIAMVGIIAAGIIVRAAYREIASGSNAPRREWSRTDAFLLGSMFANDSNNTSAHDSASSSSSFSSFDSGTSSSSSSSSDSGGGSSDGGGASGSF